MYLSCHLHRFLVLVSKAGQHFSLENSRKTDERKKAGDHQTELPAEVVRDDERGSNVRQRVHNHADLRASGLKNAVFKY